MQTFDANRFVVLRSTLVNLFGECMMPTCIMRNSFVVNLF